MEEENRTLTTEQDHLLFGESRKKRQKIQINIGQTPAFEVPALPESLPFHDYAMMFYMLSSNPEDFHTKSRLFAQIVLKEGVKGVMCNYYTSLTGGITVFRMDYKLQHDTANYID